MVSNHHFVWKSASDTCHVDLNTTLSFGCNDCNNVFERNHTKKIDGLANVWCVFASHIWFCPSTQCSDIEIGARIFIKCKINIWSAEVENSSYLFIINFPQVNMKFAWWLIVRKKKSFKKRKLVEDDGDVAAQNESLMVNWVQYKAKKEQTCTLHNPQNTPVLTVVIQRVETGAVDRDWPQGVCVHRFSTFLSVRWEWDYIQIMNNL